ncbi:MAG: hypothetical protein IPI62_15560 [Bacteroidetes bacterium]|nr:hypothetical protein [Bacteroidota bacterium]MBP9791208.1 hypothetical protein [Bacteroidia bacterium]
MGLLQLADKELWNKINLQHQTKGGVYKIIAFQNGQRIPIHRFLGSDETGVLYIGKATSYLERVIHLKTSISPDYSGSAHICGRRYRSNPNISSQFPYEILYLELNESNQPEELERELLKEYSMKFGEVPPLNAI